jgi:hypothetical protein
VSLIRQIFAAGLADIFRARFFFPPTATWTDAQEFQSMADNFVAAQLNLVVEQRRIVGIIRSPSKKIKCGTAKIIDTPTVNASDMIVPAHIAIVACLGIAYLKPQSQTRFHEHIQVAIDSSQTDIRKPLSHEGVQPGGRWVRSQFPELFQNDLPLHALSLPIVRHVLSLLVTITIIGHFVKSG